MNIRELKEWLGTFKDDQIPVEIATCPRPDEWYEIYDLELLPNYRGNMVVVINTD